MELVFGRGDIWMGLCMGGKYLECLGRVVTRIDRGLVLARIRVHLPAVDFDGVQFQLPISSLLEFAVLPLNYAFGAFGVCGCWAISVVLVVLHTQYDARG